jgi:hypothetical protein
MKWKVIVTGDADGDTREEAEENVENGNWAAFTIVVLPFEDNGEGDES